MIELNQNICLKFDHVLAEVYQKYPNLPCVEYNGSGEMTLSIDSNLTDGERFIVHWLNSEVSNSFSIKLRNGGRVPAEILFQNGVCLRARFRNPGDVIAACEREIFQQVGDLYVKGIVDTSSRRAN